MIHVNEKLFNDLIERFDVVSKAWNPVWRIYKGLINKMILE